MPIFLPRHGRMVAVRVATPASSGVPPECEPTRACRVLHESTRSLTSQDGGSVPHVCCDGLGDPAESVDRGRDANGCGEAFLSAGARPDPAAR